MNKIKDTELEQMKDLNNWKEITKGLYRYVISANACYEIHIKMRKFDRPILMANASLFLVGDWRDNEPEKFHDYLEQQSLAEIASRCEVIGNIYNNPELLEV